jgi:hypothetical protein
MSKLEYQREDLLTEAKVSEQRLKDEALDE